MTPFEFIQDRQNRGLTFRLLPDRKFVAGPACLVTQADRDFIAANREAMIDEIALFCHVDPVLLDQVNRVLHEMREFLKMRESHEKAK